MSRRTTFCCCCCCFYCCRIFFLFARKHDSFSFFSPRGKHRSLRSLLVFLLFFLLLCFSLSFFSHGLCAFDIAFSSFAHSFRNHRLTIRYCANIDLRKRRRRRRRGFVRFRSLSIDIVLLLPLLGRGRWCRRGRYAPLPSLTGSKFFLHRRRPLVPLRFRVLILTFLISRNNNHRIFRVHRILAIEIVSLEENSLATPVNCGLIVQCTFTDHLRITSKRAQRFRVSKNCPKPTISMNRGRFSTAFTATCFFAL